MWGKVKWRSADVEKMITGVEGEGSKVADVEWTEVRGEEDGWKETRR